MKKILFQFAILLFAAITSMAQAPQAFNYQGVARTAAGSPLASQAISLQLTIHDGTSGGTALYQETFPVTTNAFGLYNVPVGKGNVSIGTFNTINWGSGNKYLEVAIDPLGGFSYTSLGTTQLLSVPYAVYSNTAGTLTGTVSMGGDVTGTNAAASVVKLQGNSVSTATPTSGQVLTWNSGTSMWTPATDAGTVGSITAGTGLSGGTITTTGTISMPNVGTAGTYGSSTQVPVLTTDAQGRVTSVTNTTIPTGVTSITAGTGLTGGTITSTGTISMPTVGTAGTYGSASQVPVMTTDAEGRVTGVANTTISVPMSSDVTGTNSTASVVKIQGNNVSAAAPSSGQVLEWNSGSSSWVPTNLPVSTSGTVTTINTTAGQLTGGPISTSGTLGLATAGTAGTYGSSTQVPVFTTDAYGRVTSVTNTTISAGGSGTVTSINTAAPLSGGPITSSGTISMTTSGVTAGTYGTTSSVPTITVDSWGRITGASNTAITGIAPSGAAGGDLTGTYPNPTLISSGVTAGTYGGTTTVPSVTVDTKGRVTGASSSALTMSGDVTGTNSANTVVKIQNRSVSAAAPAAGQELTWNAGTSTWVPTTPSGGTVTTINTTAPLTGGPITSTGTIGLANSGVTAGSYGGATTIPSLTIDALGRVTSATTVNVVPSLTGTSNYLPMFTTATNLGNSNVYQNGTRLVVNNGTITHGLVAIKANADTIALYLNEANQPTIYGSERVEYTGLTDANRVGILSTTIRSISDQNGTGIEGAGNSTGVQGLAEASTASQVTGVEGDSYGSSTYSVGVGGFSANYIGAPTNSYGVYGDASGGTTNYGVYSNGAMRVQGALSKLSGSFEIDHPLDPANKYLYHSFVESPDMMNIYNGNITTDATGTAVVTMPGYFDALNKDFRYQLTVIGSFAQAMISKEMVGNTFEIKTNQPNIKVSWQVTGVRQDAWANAHRIVPEVDKAESDKGKYLAPKELGMPEDLKIGQVKSHAKRNDPAVMSHGTDANQK